MRIIQCLLRSYRYALLNELFKREERSKRFLLISSGTIFLFIMEMSCDKKIQKKKTRYAVAGRLTNAEVIEIYGMFAKLYTSLYCRLFLIVEYLRYLDLAYYI